MPPSALVLVLVVLAWIGFGVQWWWRRRDHVKTVKSMDAFLDAMEALEQSVHMPTPPADLDRRRATRVSPSPAMEPMVTVKQRRDEADVARAHAREAERRAAAAHTSELFTLRSMQEQLADPSVRAGLLLASGLGLLVCLVGALVGSLSWFWVAVLVLAVAANVAWSWHCARNGLRGVGVRVTGVRRGARELPLGGRSGAGRVRWMRARRSTSSAPTRAQRPGGQRAAHGPARRPLPRGVKVATRPAPRKATRR